MSQSVRLGRVGGVEVRASWSLGVVLALLGYSLSTTVLPDAQQGRPGWVYALVGGVTAVAFIGSLLAHELSPATVARARGVDVQDVTLWLFGGIAQLRGEVRVLTAALWHRTGDRASAELTASKVGQTGGHLLTALGVALLFFGDGLSGLWFAFLGWFLANAARGEERSARFGQLTQGWRIEAEEPDGRISGIVTLAMLREVPRTRWDTATLGSIAVPADRVTTAAPGDLLGPVLGRIGVDGRVLVFENGSLVGIVSPTDIARLGNRLELVSH